MTKRISVNHATNAAAAKTAAANTAVEASIAAADAGVLAVQPVADAAAHVAQAPQGDSAKLVAGEAHAEAADHAPAAELAMLTPADASAAAFAADGQQTTGGTGTAQTTTGVDAAQTGDTAYSDSDGNHDNTALFIGGGVLAAAVAAGVLVVNDDQDSQDDTVPPDVNLQPNFAQSSQSVTTDEDTPVTTTSVAFDEEGDPITYRVPETGTGSPQHGTVVAGATPGTFIYTPDAGYEGTDSFRVIASDGMGGGSSTQTINVTVAHVNDAPMFASDAETVTFDENTPVATTVFMASATDPDSDDTITYSLSGDDADAFTIDSDTGEVRFVASPDFEAQDSYTVTITATDADGATDTQTLTVDINDLSENAAPTFAVETATVTVDENSAAADTVVYTATATDAEGDAITYSLTGDDADAFTIDPTTGEVHFVASPDFETQDSYDVNVVATDAAGGSDTLALHVDVNDVNEAPMFSVDTATVSIDENVTTDTVVYDADTSDVDGDTVTYSLSGNDADAFTIDADTGEVHFAASPDFETQAQYDVTITATDEDGLSDTLALHVNVNDLDDTVVANLETDTDTSLNTAAEFDASGDAITFNEDANSSNNAEITGFGADDHIIVSNAEDGDYSFTSTDTDIIISFGADNGATSQITLSDVVTSDSPLVYDEATAEAALGTDFFQYA